MSGIGLYAKDLRHVDLSLREVVVLKIIYEKEKEMFNIICSEPNYDVSLQSLQEKGYIKILADNPTLEDIALRAPAEAVVEEKSDTITEVLEYLNSKLVGKNKKGFSTKSPANRKFISARFAEGYTVEDLKAVIDLKTNEWKNTNFEIYIRPETLFNATKFQTYIVASNRKGMRMPTTDMI